MNENEVTRYQGTCSCGWKGRQHVNGNDAEAAREAHLDRVIKSEGTIHDRRGIKHATDVVTVTR